MPLLLAQPDATHRRLSALGRSVFCAGRKRRQEQMPRNSAREGESFELMEGIERAVERQLIPLHLY